MAQTVDKPTHRKNADKLSDIKLKRINKRISHSRFLRLCESIFAYCVNRPSTYLCTPVGAVFLSACVSQRLRLVEKFIFIKQTFAGLQIKFFSSCGKVRLCISYSCRFTKVNIAGKKRFFRSCLCYDIAVRVADY